MTEDRRTFRSGGVLQIKKTAVVDFKLELGAISAFSWARRCERPGLFSTLTSASSAVSFSVTVMASS